MPKVKIEFTRTKRIIETATVELELSDEQAAYVGKHREMRVWAENGAIHEVKEWKPSPTQPFNNVTVDVVSAKIDGKEIMGQ